MARSSGNVGLSGPPSNGKGRLSQTRSDDYFHESFPWNLSPSQAALTQGVVKIQIELRHLVSECSAEEEQEHEKEEESAVNKLRNEIHL